MVCGILIFVLGVQILFMQKFCDSTQNMKKVFYLCDFPLRNSVWGSFFWLTESKIFLTFAVFAFRLVSFWDGSFIFVPLGCLGLWDCGPFLCGRLHITLLVESGWT